jgi:hypothetical protein
MRRRLRLPAVYIYLQNLPRMTPARLKALWETYRVTLDLYTEICLTGDIFELRRDLPKVADKRGLGRQAIRYHLDYLEMAGAWEIRYGVVKAAQDRTPWEKILEKRDEIKRGRFAANKLKWLKKTRAQRAEEARECFLEPELLPAIHQDPGYLRLFAMNG